LTYRYSSRDKGATIEVHADSPTGALISTLNYEPTGNWNTYTEKSAGLQATTGKHDLYFVFVKHQRQIEIYSV